MPGRGNDSVRENVRKPHQVPSDTPESKFFQNNIKNVDTTAPSTNLTLKDMHYL